MGWHGHDPQRANSLVEGRICKAVGAEAETMAHMPATTALDFFLIDSLGGSFLLPLSCRTTELSSHELTSQGWSTCLS